MDDEVDFSSQDAWTDKSLYNNWLWEPYRNGERVFTGIPQPLMKELITGKLTRNEMILLLYIFRLSFGFNKQKTHCYLGLGDFMRVVGLDRAGVSRGLASLVKKGIIKRHPKKGKRFIYLVNCSKYGIRAKKRDQ